MTDKEFNQLLNRLLSGLPFTLVMTRLSLALRSVIKAGGEPGAQAFRRYVALKASEGEAEGEG